MIKPDNWAISVESVTKKFRVHIERNQTLKEKVLYAGRAKYKDFIALDNVSLQVQKGSTVGLIGVNGSGKSTLLKVMSKILYPEIGTVQLNGRVSSLLELGAGFHPDFTGRENIYLNGSLMGLTRKEIDYRLDEIVDFSELGDFINEPIRSYSSGMYMRLAFSVATAVEPDILLVDEILAVGDAPFQAKCMTRLRTLQKLGKTIVIVSHDASAIEKFCDTAVWLDRGQLKGIASPKECLPRYQEQSFSRSASGTSVMHFSLDTEKEYGELKDGNNEVDKKAQLLNFELRYPGQKNDKYNPRKMDLTCLLKNKGNAIKVVPKFKVSTTDGVNLLESDYKNDVGDAIFLASNSVNELKLVFSSLNLCSGTYNLSLELWSDEEVPIDIGQPPLTFVISSNDNGKGLISMERVWECRTNTVVGDST